ncbi:hypothetical protein L226DRAFT_379094 [Lentinus tigrinus ALCF2SS1-7]|uniref:Uncharacterized protein n=1 Tax=Lentinus tigrinus ALCF2SS1-6 TaxID=1328759 RepID=A0A5C2SL12_9APHY|nr:hypothetical protein L227DRAFT_325328 [Lentinus tigrinus ALCF2SS1-6]RPD76529.1 hypothetical protein L226DRAFT_379094 [Lentinus tigrinus ALCF2SS1-7]
MSPSRHSGTYRPQLYLARRGQLSLPSLLRLFWPPRTCLASYLHSSFSAQLLTRPEIDRTTFVSRHARNTTHVFTLFATADPLYPFPPLRLGIAGFGFRLAQLHLVRSSPPSSLPSPNPCTHLFASLDVHLSNSLLRKSSGIVEKLRQGTVGVHDSPPPVLRPARLHILAGTPWSPADCF